MDPLTGALIILACLLASAFFSASETQDLDADLRGARGGALVNILAASVATAIAVRWLGDPAGIIVSTIAMTILILGPGELLPKAVAAAHPLRVAHAIALPLYLLHKALWPIHVLFDRILEPFVKRLAGGAAEARGMLTVEDVIGSAAGAARMTVKEILVPRTEIVAFPIGIRPADLLEKVLAGRYTRVPIYQGTIDKILGIVHLKDLVKLLASDGGDVASILKPVLRVPERRPILRLLAEMQRSFVHVAIVKDGFGSTLGLLTQEDILEEIVGEIRDEVDREALLAIRELPDGGFEALGRVKVVDFNRETGCEVPAERGDTLAGLVFNELGRAPRKGDVVRVPGYEFSVAEISGTRITQVRVRESAKTR